MSLTADLCVCSSKSNLCELMLVVSQICLLEPDMASFYDCLALVCAEYEPCFAVRINGCVAQEVTSLCEHSPSTGTLQPLQHSYVFQMTRRNRPHLRSCSHVLTFGVDFRWVCQSSPLLDYCCHRFELPACLVEHSAGQLETQTCDSQVF